MARSGSTSFRRARARRRASLSTVIPITWIFPSLEDWRIEPGQGPKDWSWRTPDEGDGWNDVRIVARGTRLQTVVNGVVIADFDGAGVLDDVAHRRHGVGLKGHVALQLHANDELLIQYRSIRIRTID